uniref:Putative secreted protein n=1 Tax=Anopheles triannulatus TaxID=58253 RepID=A0A2M4B258_9DIPT
MLVVVVVMVLGHKVQTHCVTHTDDTWTRTVNCRDWGPIALAGNHHMRRVRVPFSLLACGLDLFAAEWDK